MKKILGRIAIVIPAVLLQVFWYMVLLGLMNDLLNEHLGDILNAVFSVLAVIFVTGLVAKREESAYKLLWVMLMVAMPILGAMLYFFLGNKSTGRNLKKKLTQSAKKLEGTLPDSAAEVVRDENKRLYQTLAHVSATTGFPMVKNGDTRFYPFGEDMFRDMCRDLENARRYIYLEYFIIQKGKFWDTLTEILAQKVTQGVDVRVMYDDLGSIGTYSVSDIVELTKMGIKCVPFNPFLFIRSQLNNRDHRKIMIIDGRIAYSGGVNLADEYINHVEKFGVWKDIGFRITGAGVKSYLYMFTEFWNAFSGDKLPRELLLEAPEDTAGDKLPRELLLEAPEDTAGDGYILPYYDSPVKGEHTSNVLFTELLSTVTDYIWFYTPYLMLGDTLLDAFARAAERGVDVRILMPGIPDKKMVYRLSRSYYKDLLAAGVKIYEYTPGFLHGKAFVADDVIAGVGTVNLDYRSLFLHFECNALFYKSAMTEAVKQDFLTTQKESRQITTTPKGLLHNLIDHFLRLFAPLM
ncbi:MAG: cardiolipin synthase [Oscillospiraceae bacterium]|nr:cardiolipin synthase [Oscillospiraceae bacterium]